MCDLISYHIPEAVRIEIVRVDDDETNQEGDDNVRRFSIDPQITDLSILQSIIARAFNLKSDFTLKYLRRDLNTYVALKSDWDLDAAYLNSSKPFLLISIVVERHNSLSDWDIITVADLTRAAQIAATQTTSVANTFLHKVEKIVSKAFSRSSPTSPTDVSPGPLSEKQYYTYLDGEGRIRSTRELRISIYRRGVEPSLRRAVWKHLLNVYPPGLTGQQRYEYVKEKADQYNQMKSLWKSQIESDPSVDCIHNMVRKDVLRTDRSHSFYAGSGDDNPNVFSLLNILTTFALNHGVKYCQGMSDLASPLLYAMKDEAQAYICFCALMRRLRENFTLDGEAISRKFDHLSRLLQYYDPDFYVYLKQNGAQDLLFCYRWILLEMKREFPFDDALHMLEVLWSSIPPVIIDDLPLFDDDYRYDPIAMQNGLSDSSNISLEASLNQHEHDGEDEDDGQHDSEPFSISNSSYSSNDSANGINNNRNINNNPISNSVNYALNQKTSGSSVVRIPLGKRRVTQNGYSYSDQFRLMNHSLPEYGARFECGDLENSGSIRVKGFFLSNMGESAPARPGDLLAKKPTGRVIRGSTNGNGLTPRSSLPHILKPIRPIRTIRFLPKILSNDSKEIDSPDADDHDKQFCLPPKIIDKGFSLDEDGVVRRLNSLESVGSSSKNSSLDLEEEYEHCVSGEPLSVLSAAAVSSAAARLRCQQKRRLFCRLGSSHFNSTDSDYHRSCSSPSSSPLTGSLTAINNVDQIDDDYEQDLIVHCNGEYGDNCASCNNGQDWIIPRGLARSASFECLKNLGGSSSCETSPGYEQSVDGSTIAQVTTTVISTMTNQRTANGVSNSNDSCHLNANGIGNSHSGEEGGNPASRGSSSQEKERSEGYGSGSDPSDIPSEVHSAFGGTLDGNKSNSSSCSSLVILNSNGSAVDSVCTSKLKISLPSPSELGSSNAFMLFLCLTILLQHRDKIISSGLDCNEVAVYFDSYIRRHNVMSVLDAGRQLFHSYLSQWHQLGENDSDFSTSPLEFPSPPTKD